MRSVKVVRALTSRHNAIRCLYQSNRIVVALKQNSFLRTGPTIVRVVSALTRQSSSLAPEEAIIEGQEQGRPQYDAHARYQANDRPTSIGPRPQLQTLPELLNNLREISASKSGIITPLMIIRILRLIGKDEVQLDPRQSALLLRCTGKSLVYAQKKERVGLLKRILTRYEEIGLALSAEHYNAILQVNIENAVDFNPVEFLGNMESKGVSPSRATYQFLISKFCEDGNVDAASEILQHMKQSSIPVTESVFSSFITGYMKNGNTEKATQILDVMSASGIEPTGQSYASFLHAYAEKGDIEGMRATMTDATSKRMEIEDTHILSAIMVLAEAKHEQFIPEMLNVIVRRGSGADHAIIVRSLRECIAAGHEDAAVQIYHALNRTNPNTLLMPFVSMKMPFATFMSVVDKLDPQSLTPNFLDTLAKFIYRNANPSVGLEILHFLQSKGTAIDVGSVRRMLSRMKGNGSVEAIYKTAAILFEIHANNPVPLVYETSLVTSHLLQRVETVDDMSSKLQAIGHAENDVPTLIFLGYLRAGQFQAAVKYGEENSASIKESSAIATDPSPLKDVMLQGYQSCGKKLDVMLDAIKESSTILPVQAHRLNSDVLLKFIGGKDSSSEVIEKYLTLAQGKDLKILTRYKRTLLKELAGKQVPQQVVRVMDKLMPPEERIPALAELQKMATPELELLLPRVRENGNLLQISNISRILIRRYCAAENDGDKAAEIDELVHLMEANQSSYDFMTLRSLVSFYAVTMKDMLAAMRHFREVTDKFRNYKDTFRIVLIIASLQAEKGHCDRAFATAEDHLDKTSIPDEFTKSKALAGNCVKLLSVLQTKEEVDRMYTLMLKGFVAENTYSVMKGVIMAHIKLGATDAVVQDLVRFSNEYKIDPDQELLGEILSFLIKQKEEECLKQVISIVSTSKGPVYVQHALVKELVSQGNIKEAEKALQSFQPEPNMALMNRICNSFLRDQKVEAMTQLLEITKDMKGVDREQMIFWLLKLYVKMENSTAALDTFVMFQEENITPQKRTLRMVGELLNTLNVTALPAELMDPELTKLEKLDIQEPQETPSAVLADESSIATAEPEQTPTAAEVTTPSESIPNQVQDLISSLTANPELLKKYCIRENLQIVSKHCQPLAKELEMMVLSQAKPNTEAIKALVQHYFDTGRMNEAQTLMQKHADTLTDASDLNGAVPESMLHETKTVFGPTDSALMYGRLLVLKCDVGDWEGGLECYHQALQEDLMLTDDSLTVLETMLRINNQPIPW